MGDAVAFRMGPSKDETPNDTTVAETPRPFSRFKRSPTTGAHDYESDNIVDFDGEIGLYRVRCFGYSAEEDTCEPPYHFPHNAVLVHHRKKGLSDPEL